MTDTGSEITIIPPCGLVEGPGWQPIENAPVDGTEVILFYPHYLDEGFVTAGYYCRVGGDGPYCWYADLVNGYASPPTHWMPLPEAPPLKEKEPLSVAFYHEAKDEGELVEFLTDPNAFMLKTTEVGGE